MKRALLAGTVVVVALAAGWVLWGGGGEPAPAPTEEAPQPKHTAVPRNPLDLLEEEPAPEIARDGGPVDAAIEVTVTDVGGRPIASAEVTARSEETTHSATAGLDGTARLAVSAGGWRIGAAAPGFVPASAREVVTAGAVVTRAFALAPGGMIRGLVVTPAGVPVRGAKVDGAWKQGDQVPKRSAVTATDGTFTLDGIDLGARVVVRVTSDAHPVEEVGITVPDERVRIVLRPGFQVRVRVRAANGQPAVGCIVSLFPAGTAMSPGRFRGLSWQRGPTWKATGEDGVALFQGIAPGAFVAYARHEPADAGESDEAPFGSAKATADRPVTELEIRLWVGHMLRGRVTDQTGAAVDDARILIKKGAETIEYERSGADGSFTAQLFESAPWQVSAMATGYEAARAESMGGTVTVVMKKLPMLTGRIVDGTGAPIPRFKVNDVETVAPDGRFAIPQRPAFRTHELSVTASGFAPAKASIPEAKTDFGDVVLQRGTSLTVTVVDAVRQKPIAGAQVLGPGTFSPNLLDDVASHDAVATDANGAATLSDVGDGAVLQVRHADYVTAQVAVPAGAAVLRVTLEEGGVLRVGIPGDRPAGGLELVRFPDQRSMLFVRAKESSFHLSPGRYALRMVGRRPPEQAREVQIAAGRETEVALSEPQGTPFVVEVKPLPRLTWAYVVAGDVPAPTRAAEWSWMTAVAARERLVDGMATFPALPPGRVTVFVVAFPGYHRAVADIAEGRLAIALPPNLPKVPTE